MKIMSPVGKSIFKRCLYESPSGLKMYQNLRFRWLTFGNQILQTVIHRRHPERAALQYITSMVKIILTTPGDCCLLGLGGAGVAHALWPGLKSFRIVAVDNSQEVIDIATHYFDLSRIDNLVVIHQDANDFVISASGNYQHLLIDLHNADSFPPECNHPDFFAHCYALLKPGGTLILNVIHIHKNRLLFKYIQQQFNGCTVVLPVKGTTNALIVAYRLADAGLLLDVVQKASFVKRLVWDDNWGYIGDAG